MDMSDTPMTNDTARRTGPAETIEPGVAHVEIAPGAPTETTGRGPLQVDDETDDETGERAPRGAPADRPTTGNAGQA